MSQRPKKNTPKGDYEVGYCRPPRQNQFQPGKSGNVKGRPVGHKNFKTELEEELEEIVNITEQGKRRPVSKRRAILKKLMNQGLNGDMRALSLLFKYGHQAASDEPPEVTEEELSESEAERLEAYVRRRAKRLQDEGAE